MNKDIKSLYIHIPFCEHICDYCDFTKLQYFTNFATSYLIALKKELDSYQINEPLETIYVGGGTPTSLEDDLFLSLLKIIKPYTMGVKEYTFEANPESLSINKLKLMQEYGVNRLSVGVESTNNDILKAINRHHSYEDVKKAIKNAQNIGFNNINVDLILGLPNVTKKLLENDIDNLLTLNIQHISCYSLTIHPHTRLYIKGYKEISDDESRELYDLVAYKLNKAGFIHYEVSNWCLKNYQSKHNLTYWKDKQYYGIGLGASGYINNLRYTNTKNLTTYLKGNYVQEKEIVDENDDLTYFIMLNLRTNEGINLKEFEKRFHFSFLKTYEKQLEELFKLNLLVFDQENEQIYATYGGLMTLDSLILKLIS